MPFFYSLWLSGDEGLLWGFGTLGGKEELFFGTYIIAMRCTCAPLFGELALMLDPLELRLLELPLSDGLEARADAPVCVVFIVNEDIKAT